MRGVPCLTVPHPCHAAAQRVVEAAVRFYKSRVHQEELAMQGDGLTLDEIMNPDSEPRQADAEFYAAVAALEAKPT
jgi:hypothetical protein